ncbi:MAG TPA: DUF4393 domain-containing protein [Roseateles sp.]|uniref:DUF4393 domain-containing protein n=1 Tax=Roseateles sp. TaxID=1971397 RepID=UPI002ED8FD60
MTLDLAHVADAFSKFTGLLETIYADLAQPGVRQVGKALETSLGLGNTLLIPISLVNERARILFTQNMDKYRKEMETVPEDEVIPAAPEIAVPIIEKLTYVSDEKLSDLYTKLLASASDKRRVKNAHPSFVNVINNISPDEAILLPRIYREGRVPYLTALAQRIGEPGTISLGNATEDRLAEGLVFEENVSAYLANLSGLGILEVDRTRWLKDVTRYEALEKDATPLIELQMRSTPHLRDRELHFQRGIVEITAYGIVFITACGHQ